MLNNSISHEQVKNAFSVIYNKFYLSNKLDDKRLRTEQEWNKIIEEAKSISKEFNSVFVDDMIKALLLEWDRQEKNIKYI